MFYDAKIHSKTTHANKSQQKNVKNALTNASFCFITVIGLRIPFLCGFPRHGTYGLSHKKLSNHGHE